ncbi:MAG TPA: TonB-dependent siderophore receptor [Pyrinomonadaceae bacterium]|nr:TonB-dependent siderophore receptor [Pyrinomonadaceae bacterium]
MINKGEFFIASGRRFTCRAVVPVLPALAARPIGHRFHKNQHARSILTTTRRILGLGLVGVTGALLSYAQVVPKQPSLRGKVVDQYGAAVAGATVIAEPKDRSASFSSVTDQTGGFTLTLDRGEYVVRVVADGFSATSQSVTLSQSGDTAVEAVLQVAAIAGSVTVFATGTYQTDSISSATKTLTPLLDVPQSVVVVTKEQIRDQLMQSVGDVARYTPGLSVHQGENNRDQIIFRGQSSTADFFLNGVRDDAQYHRDLYNLERFETLKGPNAMIFGRGGGGGVINRVTKEASFSALREISAVGGSFGNRRISADFDQPFSDKLAFRLNSVYENSNSYRKFVNLNRFAINPTFTIVPSDQTTFTIGYEFARDRRTADRGITSFQGRPADVPISTFYGNPEDSHVRSDVSLLSGTIDHQVGKLTIRNRTLFGDYDRFYQNYVPGAVNAGKSLVTLTAYNNATKRRNFFNQTDLNYLVSTGPIEHTLLGGVEVGRQLTDNFRNTGFFSNSTTFIQVAYDHPTISTPVIYRQSGTDADNHVKTSLAATYLQDQIKLSRHAQLVLGLRYDYFDLRYHNNRNAKTLRRIDNLVSPRVGLVIKPVAQLSLYSSYSVSYLPSSGDQFSALTSVTEQVKPEQFANYELGAKWDIRRNLSFTSALYRLNRTNTRSIDPNNPAAIIQTGSQRTNGFEVGLNGNITRAWSTTGGYSYQDAFITSATTVAIAGKQVGQVPRHTLSFWNKYQILARLGVGLGIISRSEMFVAVDNSVVVPGYTRADGALYYSLNERWRLQGNIENLFNSRYYLNADGNTNISPGSPRALRIGLIARF